MPIMTYPADWPRCPACGEPALDGHITCGRVQCDEHRQRRKGERWGVLARRSSSSQFGAATAWCKDETSPTGLLLFDTHEKAATMAEHYNSRTVSPNVSYVAARYE
jgi:hypothetical protein